MGSAVKGGRNGSCVYTGLVWLGSRGRGEVTRRKGLGRKRKRRKRKRRRLFFFLYLGNWCSDNGGINGTGPRLTAEKNKLCPYITQYSCVS